MYNWQSATAAVEVRQNLEEMLWGFDSDAKNESGSEATWQQDMDIFMNMDKPWTESNFYDENGKGQKPATAEDYSWHMGFVHKGDRMIISHSIHQRTWNGQRYYFDTELRLSLCWVGGNIGRTNATKTCHNLNAYIFETNNRNVINNTSLDSL
jgi:hypothetical protein